MTTEINAGPFGWFADSALRRLILTRGLAVLAVAVGLSLLLTLLALLALGVGAAQAFSGFTSGSFSSSSGQGPEAGQLAGAFLVIFGFVFFTAHLAPFNADISFLGSSIYGVGSLLVAGVVVVFAYQSGRRIEQRFPYSLSNGESAMRAAFIVVPYWIGCLLLFLVSSIHAQTTQFGNATLGPSALGLVTPLLLVGGAAAVGARRQRGGPVSLTSSYATRGAVLALFAIALGTLASLVGAIIAGLIGLATHSSAFSPSSSSSTGPSPTVSPNGLGPIFALLAILVAIFYIPNGLFWLWGSALGFDLAAAGWLILAFGIIGALLGALTIRPRPDPTEQVSFAVSFGVASFLLAFISRPTIGAQAVGGNPLIVLIVGLVLGTALAIVGPYAARTGLGQSALALPLMAAALRRLPLPGEGGAPVVPTAGEAGSPAWARDAGAPGPGWSASPSGPATAVMAPPAAPARVEPMRIHFGKRARIATAVAVLAIAAVVGLNIYLASATTAEAAASAYEQAVGNNDAGAIWSHLQVNEPAGLGIAAAQSVPRLLSENDLKAMLSLPQNKHQARTNIAFGGALQSGDNAAMQVSFQQQGQNASETLALVRDNSQHQFLLYPVWKVLVTPGSLSVNLPAKGSRIAVDGTQLPTDVGMAFVLPGAHTVTLLASGPFDATDEIATVQSQATAQVSFSNMKPTPAAKTAAAATAKTYFTSCLQRTDSSPSDCPQRLTEYVPTPIQWHLVGDPTTSLAVSVDPTSQAIMATGHYLMTATYTSDAGAVHRVSGGTYCLPLAWNGQSFDIQNQGFGFGCQQIPPLPDPGANQASVLAAVSAGWQACLKVTIVNPPDCPASASAYQPTNLKWTSATDPMAGAQVTWDGQTGVYKVSGNYSLVASYSDFFGSSQSNNLSGSYTASVTWDGQTASLANIGPGGQ